MNKLLLSSISMVAMMAGNQADALVHVTPPPPPMTQAQETADYNAMVAKGIAAGVLPSNFASTVKLAFSASLPNGSGAVYPNEATFTAANGSTPATITLLTGLRGGTDATLETYIAHELGVAENQTEVTYVAQVAKTYGVSNWHTIAQMNIVESNADIAAAKIMGAQAYLSEMGGLAEFGTIGSPYSLFLRAVAIAKANPGVKLAIPFTMIPGGTTNDVSLNIEYTMVNGTATLNTAVSSPQIASLITSSTVTIDTDAEKGLASIAEYNGGALDIDNVGVNAAITNSAGTTLAYQSAVATAEQGGASASYLNSLKVNYALTNTTQNSGFVATVSGNKALGGGTVTITGADQTAATTMGTASIQDGTVVAESQTYVAQATAQQADAAAAANPSNTTLATQAQEANLDATNAAAITYVNQTAQALIQQGGISTEDALSQATNQYFNQPSVLTLFIDQDANPSGTVTAIFMAVVNAFNENNPNGVNSDYSFTVPQPVLADMADTGLLPEDVGNNLDYYYGTISVQGNQIAVSVPNNIIYGTVDKGITADQMQNQDANNGQTMTDTSVQQDNKPGDTTTPPAANPNFNITSTPSGDGDGGDGGSGDGDGDGDGYGGDGDGDGYSGDGGDGDGYE